MSEVRLRPLERLGFDFVESPAFSRTARRKPPFGTVEADWRPLNSDEISRLVEGGNRADDWANIRVLDGFKPALVSDCRFFGEVRIGVLSHSCLEFHDLRLPVGLVSCTVVSCDIGSNAAIHNVRYMAHYTIEERCLLFNIDEMLTTNHAKFGNGVVMDGEDEDVRIWLEVANENGGRRILPFDGLLPSDAWIWSKYRDDKELMQKFVEMTGKVRSPYRGLYGRVGAESVIKDCRIIKDVCIGESAYVKGCNKLKNLTINSRKDTPTQLGEGCELVNGIIGCGCRVFYGVKAVRFVLCGHSNLKYGARLINSVLGSNSTISCCEVLNSLIFGSHEQHHNSSFLCAAVLKGQTNMASAATVGSNHNSRANDGEIVADRGFWPGLSVSLKHNSRFAAFCLIVKGAYPAELDVPLPFTLVSNSESSGELILMPGYWFRHNMYALARNASKSAQRDKRTQRVLNLEYDWLAPDTADQMLRARTILELWANHAPAVAAGDVPDGRALLETSENPDLFAAAGVPVEAGGRPVRIIRASRAWKNYGRMLRFYAVRTVLEAGPELEAEQLLPLFGTTPLFQGGAWESIGGQLMPQARLEELKDGIRSGRIQSWPEVHQAYGRMGELYEGQKLSHAVSILAELNRRPSDAATLKELLQDASDTANFICSGIESSRRKDYENPFRSITFDSDAERDAVIGRFEENPFIKEARETNNALQSRLNRLISAL